MTKKRETPKSSQRKAKSQAEPASRSEQRENSARIKRRGNPEKIRPHQFKPGQSGNPGGRPKTTPLTDALCELLNKPYPGDAQHRTLAQVIAAAQVTRAAKGSIAHFNAVADRVEGKPRQMMELAGPDGAAIPVFVENLDERLRALIDRARTRAAHA